MAVDALEDVVRAEINTSLAAFDFDPAPRVVAALQRSGFVTPVGIPTTTHREGTE